MSTRKWRKHFIMMSQSNHARIIATLHYSNLLPKARLRNALTMFFGGKLLRTFILGTFLCLAGNIHTPDAFGKVQNQCCSLKKLLGFSEKQNESPSQTTCKVVTKLVKQVVLYNLTGDPKLANQSKPPEILGNGKPTGETRSENKQFVLFGTTFYQKKTIPLFNMSRGLQAMLLAAFILALVFKYRRSALSKLKSIIKAFSNQHSRFKSYGKVLLTYAKKSLFFRCIRPTTPSFSNDQQNIVDISAPDNNQVTQPQDEFLGKSPNTSQLPAVDVIMEDVDGTPVDPREHKEHQHTQDPSQPSVTPPEGCQFETALPEQFNVVLSHDEDDICQQDSLKVCLEPDVSNDVSTDRGTNVGDDENQQMVITDHVSDMLVLVDYPDEDLASHEAIEVPRDGVVFATDLQKTVIPRPRKPYVPKQNREPREAIDVPRDIIVSATDVQKIVIPLPRKPYVPKQNCVPREAIEVPRDGVVLSTDMQKTAIPLPRKPYVPKAKQTLVPREAIEVPRDGVVSVTNMQKTAIPLPRKHYVPKQNRVSMELSHLPPGLLERSIIEQVTTSEPDDQPLEHNDHPSSKEDIDHRDNVVLFADAERREEPVVLPEDFVPCGDNEGHGVFSIDFVEVRNPILGCGGGLLDRRGKDKWLANHLTEQAVMDDMDDDNRRRFEFYEEILDKWTSMLNYTITAIVVSVLILVPCIIHDITSWFGMSTSQQVMLWTTFILAFVVMYPKPTLSVLKSIIKNLSEKYHKLSRRFTSYDEVLLDNPPKQFNFSRTRPMTLSSSLSPDVPQTVDNNQLVKSRCEVIQAQVELNQDKFLDKFSNTSQVPAVNVTTENVDGTPMDPREHMEHQHTQDPSQPSVTLLEGCHFEAALPEQSNVVLSNDEDKICQQDLLKVVCLEPDVPDDVSPDHGTNVGDDENQQMVITDHVLDMREFVLVDYPHEDLASHVAIEVPRGGIVFATDVQKTVIPRPRKSYEPKQNWVPREAIEVPRDGIVFATDVQKTVIPRPRKPYELKQNWVPREAIEVPRGGIVCATDMQKIVIPRPRKPYVPKENLVSITHLPPGLLGRSSIEHVITSEPDDQSHKHNDHPSSKEDIDHRDNVVLFADTERREEPVVLPEDFVPCGDNEDDYEFVEIPIPVFDRDCGQLERREDQCLGNHLVAEAAIDEDDRQHNELNKETVNDWTNILNTAQNYAPTVFVVCGLIIVPCIIARRYFK